MEKYSKAVSETYSKFKNDANPLEKYVGRLFNPGGGDLEVVGYRSSEPADEQLLIIDASKSGGWTTPGPSDVIFKECDYYLYVSINDLTGQNYD